MSDLRVLSQFEPDADKEAFWRLAVGFTIAVAFGATTSVDRQGGFEAAVAVSSQTHRHVGSLSK